MSASVVMGAAREINRRRAAQVDPRSNGNPHRPGLSPHGSPSFWNKAFELVGEASREEAEAALTERLASLRRRLAPTVSSMSINDTSEETISTVEEHDNANLLEFLLSPEDDDKPSTEDGQTGSTTNANSRLEDSSLPDEEKKTASTFKSETKTPSSKEKKRHNFNNEKKCRGGSTFNFDHYYDSDSDTSSGKVSTRSRSAGRRRPAARNAAFQAGSSSDDDDFSETSAFGGGAFDGDIPSFHFGLSDSSEKGSFSEGSGSNYSVGDFSDQSEMQGDSENDHLSEEPDSVPEETQADFMTGLIRLLESGRRACAEVDEKPVVIIIGPTGAGKSLLIQAIDGQRFKRKFSDQLQKYVYRVRGKGLKDFSIGQDFRSETRHVRAYMRRETGTYYVDSSGFGDNQFAYTDLATSLSVKDLARRCSKLRIAVLVNAYTFFSDRATHLRNLLALVKQFVGRDFMEFREAFTFIFTHCRDAFAVGDPATLRERLVCSLKGVRKFEVDRDLGDLIDFMRSSLEQGQPFCDIFEPGISSVPDLCRNLEPSRNSLVNPSSIVRCALTSQSRLRLSQEMQSHKEAIDEKLTDHVFDDELNEIVSALVTLSGFVVDEHFCTETVAKVKTRFMKAKNELDDQILGVARRVATPTDTSVPFDANDVTKAKECIDSLKQLMGFIQMCESNMHSVEKGVSDDSESNNTEVDPCKKITDILRGQGDWILQEFEKAKTYLDSREKPLEDTEKPDFAAICTLLQKLRAWADVFEEMKPIAAEAKESIVKGLFEAHKALESQKTEDNAVVKAYGCLRIVAFLRQAGRSGLLDYVFGQSDLGRTKKKAHFNQAAQEARIIAERALSDINHFMTKSQLDAFSEQVDVVSLLRGGTGAASRAFGQLLHVAVDLSSFVAREGLSHELECPMSRLRLLEGIMVTFRQHWIVCDRMIGQLNPGTVLYLEPCLCSLRGVAWNIPPTLRTEGMFCQDVDVLVQKLTKAFAAVVSSVGRSTKRGIRGDIKTQVMHYRTLGCGLWFDRWLKDVASPGTIHEQLQRGSFFRKAFALASRSYHSRYSTLSKRLGDAFDKLLSEESSSKVVEDASLLIVGLWDELLSCRELVQRDEGHQDTVTVLMSRLEDWCNKQKEQLNFTADVCGLPFERIDRILHVARGLRDVELRGIPLQSFASGVVKKLKYYSKSMLELMQDSQNGRAKASLLDLAQSWSKLPMLRWHLPGYEQLREVGLRKFTELAQGWLDHVSTTRVQDIDVEACTSVVKKFGELAPLLDKHFDGVVQSWADRIASDMEIRVAKLDIKFKGFVADNEYDGILRYLSKLEAGNARNRQSKAYTDCLYALEHRWDGMFASLRSRKGNLKAQDLSYMREIVAILAKAEDKLGHHTGKLPSWGCTLSDRMTRFREDIVTDLSATLDQADEAARNLEYGEAHSCMNRANLLKNLVPPGSWERKFHSVREIVGALLPDVSARVDKFLTSLSATSHVSSSAPGKLRDTTKLIETLRKLWLSAEREDCADDVKEAYTKECEKLSEGITRVYDSLQQDIAVSSFSRPRRLLSFLREEICTKGMKDHLTITFDVVAAMNDLTDAELKHQNTMRTELFKSSYVEGLVRELDKMKAEAGMLSWSEPDDYKEECRRVEETVTEMVKETEDMIRNGEFMGMRARFCSIESVRAKLGGHVSLGDTLQRLVSEVLYPQLSALDSDLERYLGDDLMTIFDELFNKTIHLLEGISESEGSCSRTQIQSASQGITSLVRAVTGDEQSKEESVLDAYDGCCRQLQTSLHACIATKVETLTAEFRAVVARGEYETAAKMVSTVRGVGRFLATSFEVYRCSLCDKVKNDDHLERLHRLNLTHFSNDAFLGFGRHLSVLQLPITASFEDVQNCYKGFRERWEGNQDSSDDWARKRFNAVNASWDYLSGNKGAFDVHVGYEFKIVVETMSEIVRKVRVETDSMIASGEYERLGEMYRELNSLKVLVEKVGNVGILDAQVVKDSVTKAVCVKLSELEEAVDRASLWGDSRVVHEAFSAIEGIEAAFKGELGPSSVASKVVRKQRLQLRQLRDSATRIDSNSDEKIAFSKLTDFGVDLISIGRIIDGLPLLRKEGEEVVNQLIESFRDVSWGVSFVFKLGEHLARGDIVQDDDGARIGRMILTVVPHFKDVRTAIFNTKVVSAPVDETIEGTELRCCEDDLELRQVPIDRTALAVAFRTYKSHYDQLFGRHAIDKGPDKLVEKVYRAARRFGDGGVCDWDDDKRNVLIEVLAGVFATFTLLMSGNTFKGLEDQDGSESDEPTSVLFSPHNVQVIAVLRLLGIASSDESGIENHIMEIRTGEGKSVVLGALATVLALVGFKVRCVCYSQHLSERDSVVFRDVFVAFRIEDRITYSKIDTMSEASVSEIGDIRRLTTDMIKGKKRSPGKGEWRGAVRKNSLEGPNPLNGEDVLLVDEVDVFFGADFYGKTYNVVAHVDDPLFEELLRKVWDCRGENLTLSVVKEWAEYERVAAQFSDWSDLIDREIECMCSDVVSFNIPAYEVDNVNCRIGYAVMNAVDWEATYGYRTAFAFLKELEKGVFGRIGYLGRELSLRVSCGQFSYANVRPSLTLGVSGTLRDLCKQERSIVREMGVDLFSFVPSLYGPSNLLFDVGGSGIVIEEGNEGYFQALEHEIKKAIFGGGSVLVFFENSKRLREFMRSSRWRTIQNGQVLDSRTTAENREYIIREAATTGKVTIATASFGRGTDFFTRDKQLEENGGMTVVQSFLSYEKSEETQIKGRTARQGKCGTYMMVLLESDLCERFGIRRGVCKTKPRADLYKFLDEKRRAVHERNLERNTVRVFKETERRDTESRRYLNALVQGDEEVAGRLLHKMYGSLKKKTSNRDGLMREYNVRRLR